MNFREEVWLASRSGGSRPPSRPAARVAGLLHLRKELLSNEVPLVVTIGMKPLTAPAVEEPVRVGGGGLREKVVRRCNSGLPDQGKAPGRLAAFPQPAGWKTSPGYMATCGLTAGMATGHVKSLGSNPKCDTCHYSLRACSSTPRHSPGSSWLIFLSPAASWGTTHRWASARELAATGPTGRTWH